MRVSRLLVRVVAVVLLFGLAAGCTHREIVRLKDANRSLGEKLDAAKRDLAAAENAKRLAESELTKRDKLVALAQADAKRWKEKFEAAGTSGAQMGAVIAELERKMRGEGIPGLQYKRTEIGVVLEIPSDILFDSGLATLKPGGLKTVKQIAAVLKGGGELLRIEGHTDNQPIKVSPWKDNWELSAARARTVLAALEKEGIKPERMFLAGFSYYKPIDSNATPRGRARNRRVEILMVPALLSKPMPAGTK